MRIIDVSLPIGPNMMTWPGDPSVSVERTSSLERGDPANVSLLRMGTHTGTHVDPPSHFVEGGAGIDEVALDILIGPALVAELPGHGGPIGPDELDGLDIPPDTQRLLMKTANSELWARDSASFPDSYAALSTDGAVWIVERGIRLIGIDFLSIEATGDVEFPVHRTLLGAGVVIVEGLNLAAVSPGHYELVCLPLKIRAGDGGPARAALIQR